MAINDHVQSRSADNGTAGTSFSLQYTSAVAAGNLLVVAMRTGAGGATSVDLVTGVADDINGPWTQRAVVFHPVDLHFLFIYDRLATKAGTPTVTVTMTSPGANCRWCIQEASGFSLQAGLDVVVGASSGTTPSTTPSTGSAPVTAAAEELLFGALSWGGAGTGTAGTGYTKRQEVTGKVLSESRVVTAIGTYVADGSNLSDNWCAILATYQSALANIPPSPSEHPKFALRGDT